MATVSEQLPLTVDVDIIERVVLRPGPEFTDDDFFDFCQRQNKLLRIERSSQGEIIIMAPVGFKGGAIEFDVAGELREWARRDRRGRGFGPNAGITLPDNSVVAPDAFWVPTAQWKALPVNERDKFARIVPAFVIEIRSPSDRLKDLHEKMLAYLRNGVELGWLIDPIARTVGIYKPGEPLTDLDNPPTVQGEGPVSGFVLDLRKIYDELDA